MNDQRSAKLTREKRDRLVVLASGPRDYRSDDALNRKLEGDGLIRRLKATRMGRFGLRPAIQWDITEEGSAALREG